MSTTLSPSPLESTEVAPTVQKKGAARVGWTLTALVIAFLAFDVFGKLTTPQVVVDATLVLGFTADQLVPIGIMLAVSLVLFSIPRTTFLGAVVPHRLPRRRGLRELPDAPSGRRLRAVAGLRRRGDVGRAVPPQREAAGADRCRSLTRSR